MQTPIKKSQTVKPFETSFADRFLAKVDQIHDSITTTVNDALKSDSDDNDSSKEPEVRPSREKLRAYQAQAFKSFTAGASLAEK